MFLNPTSIPQKGWILPASLPYFVISCLHGMNTVIIQWYKPCRKRYGRWDALEDDLTIGLSKYPHLTLFTSTIWKWFQVWFQVFTSRGLSVFILSEVCYFSEFSLPLFLLQLSNVYHSADSACGCVCLCAVPLLWSLHPWRKLWSDLWICNNVFYCALLY